MKLITSTCLLFLGLPLFAEPTVSIVGVQIGSRAYAEPGDKFGGGLRPFNWSLGSRIAVLVENADGGIVKTEMDDMEVETFTDDSGKSLLDKKGFRGKKFQINFPEVSQDGKAMIFTLETKETPTAGSKGLPLKATVPVTIAKGVQSVESKPLTPTKGEKFEIDGLAFELSEAKKPDWGDAEIMIELKIEQSLEDVKTINFRNANGDLIKTSSAGSSRSGFLNKVTETLSFNFEKKPDTFVVELERYKDLEVINVQVDTTVRLGN